MRLGESSLYVADAVYGVYSVNLMTKVVTSLVAPDALTPRIGLADDLCLFKDENFIYFSDVSSKYSISEVGSQILAGMWMGILTDE